MNTTLKIKVMLICSLVLASVLPINLSAAENEDVFPIFGETYSPRRSGDIYTFKLDKDMGDTCPNASLDTAEYLGCTKGRAKLILLKNNEEIATYTLELPNVPGMNTRIISYDDSRTIFKFRVRFIRSVTPLAPHYYLVEIDRYIH